GRGAPPSGLGGRREAEADASHGVDVPGRPRVIVQLLPQSADVDVERLRRAEPVRIPHFVDQPLARHDRACVLDQEAQEVELLAAELQLLAAERDAPASWVDANVSDLRRTIDPALRSLGSTPEHGPDPRDELAAAEELHH